MARSGETTKQKILDAAEELVFEHGFAAMSLDSVLERAALTKGAFFYHFKSKADLGCMLIERFAARDLDFMESSMQRAEKLSDDPLQQLLIFVGLMVETFEDLAEPAAGCLFASYIYQPLEFSGDVARIASGAILKWRERILGKLEAIREAGGRDLECDLASLADQLTVVFEGSYVLSKVLGDPALPARQLRHFRRYLEFLFLPDRVAGG